jgi:hypothetical protein
VSIGEFRRAILANFVFLAPGRSFDMKNGNTLQTHSWSAIPRKILHDGRTTAQHRCIRCGRDFGFELDGSGWHAVYIGVFRLEHLDEEITGRWLSEECPKEILANDDVDRDTVSRR